MGLWDAFRSEQDRVVVYGLFPPEQEVIVLGVVEDSVLSRLVEGRAETALTIFYLCNRAPHRWRNVKDVRFEPEPRTDLDVSLLTDNEVLTLDRLLAKASRVEGRARS